MNILFHLLDRSSSLFLIGSSASSYNTNTNNQSNNDSLTPIFDCPYFHFVMKGDVMEVERVLRKSKNPNRLAKEPFPTGWTPLFLAASENRVHVISLLLQYGASVNDYSNGVLPIHIACLRGHMDTLSLLLSHGANVHSCLEDGRSCLLLAVHENHMLIVRELIRLGADVNKARVDGFTSLSVACKFGRTEMVSLLLENGALFQQPINSEGVTPLFLAVQHNHTECALFLIEKGANVKNVKMKSTRENLLHTASSHGNLEIVHSLLQHGMSIDDRTNNGETSLYLAAERGYVEVVTCLLENGADVNVTNHIGSSPLIAAITQRHLSVVSVILEYTPDVLLVGEDGTAMEVAKKKMKEAVPLIRKYQSDSLLKEDWENDDWQII